MPNSKPTAVGFETSLLRYKGNNLKNDYNSHVFIPSAMTKNTMTDIHVIAAAILDDADDDDDDDDVISLPSPRLSPHITVVLPSPWT